MPEIILPKTFEGLTNDGRAISVPNHYTGRVTLPARWFGGDYEAYHKEAAKDVHVWLHRWQWAKGKIVEWAIEGLSTNPQQIKDNDLSWGLMAFLTKAVYGAMHDYADNRSEAIKKKMRYPTAENLTAGEFFEWHRQTESAEKGLSDIARAWYSYYHLVRQWPDDSPPERDFLKADLAIATAVAQIGSDAIRPALDLGNWLRPPGAASNGTG